MRVYISGAVDDVQRIRKLIQAVRGAGHEITLDWTQLSTQLPYLQHVVANRPLAETLCNAVARCDVLVFVDHSAARGALVELGLALAHQKRIIVCGNILDSIFYTLPLVEVVQSDTDMFHTLAFLASHEVQS